VISKEKELEIMRKYEAERLRVGTIARQVHVHRVTVLRVVRGVRIQRNDWKPRSRRIDKYLSIIDDLLVRIPTVTTAYLYSIVCQQGFLGSPSHFRSILRDHRCNRGLPPKGSALEMRRQEWLEWLYLLEKDQLPSLNGDTEVDRQKLLFYVKQSNGRNHQRALVILARQCNFSIATISRCLGVGQSTIRGYVKRLSENGIDAIFRKRGRPLKSDDSELKKAVFGLLHEPPALSDVNRTTWKMDDLQRVLAHRGHVACKDVIRKIIKDAGFKLRNARTVLTSNDPKYREKLDHLQSVLSKLACDEVFFSIDEYGPFAIKITGGKLLAAPGVNPTIPQWQRTKGSLIVTAALELSTNQITHFYSDAKNTEEMIKMAEILIAKYQDFRTIFLSWDAASWHISKSLSAYIAEYNSIVEIADLPQIKLLPLPAGAQFLNVIESVFSGMARAIIHNSNYASKLDASSAIDRYLEERNMHFELDPKKAGNKIWGMERTSSSFHASNNCKDPAYR
jgi:transposase